MKKRWFLLAICIAIPLAVGGVSALLTRNGMDVFSAVIKPPLSPPAWLFPVVWTVLYVLMGVASYLVLTAKQTQANALYAYIAQLILNFFWSIIFFDLQNYLFAFIWLLMLWIAVLITMILFFRVRTSAGILMIPYLVWVTFAGYLNLSIYLLNK